MAQEDQEENAVDLVNHNMQRKRGRPRKDGTPRSEPYKRTRRPTVDVDTHGSDPFVGQLVSGVLDGKFDAGYMLTVRVGEGGGVLRGVVFEPGLSVPISAANDIAPNVRMFKRDEVSLPNSAGQFPSFAPVRSRKDGASRQYQRSESSVSKGIRADMIAEDPNMNARMHSSEDIKIQRNDSNLAPGNLKQGLASTCGDNVLNDGDQNIQSSNASDECTRNIHLPEVVGNPSIVASNSCKIVNLQDVIGDGKLIVELSQSLSESKQAATSDGTPGFTSDMTANPQEVVKGVNKLGGTSQVISETKQAAETSDVGSKLADDNKIARLHEIVSDSKPANEFYQTRVLESKQLLETIDSGQAFTNGGSDDYIGALPPVTVQAPEHVTEGVGEPLNRTESSVDECTGLHPVKPALADGTAEVAKGTNSYVGQESQVHPEPVVFGSSNTVELATEPLKDDMLAPHVVIPELQGVQATPCGVCTVVSSGATTELTNGSCLGTEVDVINGRSEVTEVDTANVSSQGMEVDIPDGSIPETEVNTTHGSSLLTEVDAANGSSQAMEVEITNGSSQVAEVN